MNEIKIEHTNGRTLKAFEDLSDRQKRRRTKEIRRINEMKRDEGIIYTSHFKSQKDTAKQYGVTPYVVRKVLKKNNFNKIRYGNFYLQLDSVGNSMNNHGIVNEYKNYNLMYDFYKEDGELLDHTYEWRLPFTLRYMDYTLEYEGKIYDDMIVYLAGSAGETGVGWYYLIFESPSNFGLICSTNRVFLSQVKPILAWMHVYYGKDNVIPDSILDEVIGNIGFKT